MGLAQFLIKGEDKRKEEIEGIKPGGDEKD
jgi:hypothetical protein